MTQLTPTTRNWRTFNPALEQSADDLIANMRMKRQNYRRTGSCTGGVCVGWNSQNVMWAVTHDMDAELGTNYQERLVIQFFTAIYRAYIGACVAGQGDVMIGASILMARANGLSTRMFMGKLVDMSVNNQVTYGLGAGACAMGSQHPSGSFFADPLTAHTNKVMVATLPYEVKRLTQEIGGGIAETGCMPSYKDVTNPKYGHLLQKYLKAGAPSGETRFKAARLAEWLTIGAGVPGCMHGGGSPDGAKLVIRFTTPMEEYADYARKIMDIEESVLDPQKPQKK